MYEGSLYGSGAVVFAVMGYVIATQMPDRELGSQVTLNPRKLADTLGEEVGDVEKAIEFLCKPDPQSTTKKAEGRRLIKVGEFEYQVVNGAKYRAIRDEEERRAQNREAKRRQREKASGKTQAQVHAEFVGRENRWNNARTTEEADAILSEGLDHGTEESGAPEVP